MSKARRYFELRRRSSLMNPFSTINLLAISKEEKSNLILHKTSNKTKL
jgi:hypothetical protein